MPARTSRQVAELMSPAGYWPELQAAIEAGADAVYFGLKHFSARAKVGFSLDELADVMETLHQRGVKGFVTFNTLVFDHELDDATKAIEAIASAGCDAIIVQDIGVAKLAQTVAPTLSLHGSTQMSITSAEGAELAKSFGCERVVLGRELSLKDIRKIAEKTDVELETFVHGALCVSYSGQCFSSEAWGGRSANRGKCAQACRLSYDLVVDGEPRDLGPYRYLLSPGDLYALEQVPELVDIGIACLKIEGRYKDAEYVAMTTRAYREAIDAAKANLKLDATTHKQNLEQIYSRGLGPHFISGVDHQTVVVGRAPRHRGIRVGEVVDVRNDAVVVRLEQEISPGDGLVFDAADWRSPDEPEEGGNVYEVFDTSNRIDRLLKFGYGEIDFARIRVGDLVWRTRNPVVEKSVKSIVNANKPVFTRPIDFVLFAKSGKPLRLLGTIENGISTEFEGDVLQPAKSQPADPEKIHSQLDRLGGTPFHLGSLELQVDFNSFIPVSLLNQARRFVVEQLLELRVEPAGSPTEIEIAPHSQFARDQIVADLKTSWSATGARADEEPGTTRLHLLVRTPEQLDAAIEECPDSITLDYLELYGLRPSVEKIKSANIEARVASPRILKPSEQNVIRFLLSLECTIVVRSGGLLFDLKQQEMTPPKLVGDFSLNITNEIAAWSYLGMGADVITPGYDLNSLQIEELAERVPPQNMEIIAYAHLPVFHTEHCVFCRFLSDGTDHTNCGHPCETHRISVRDQQGREHPVMADVGCRNTVFGAEAQTDPTALDRWLAAGIQDFRLEFVHQSPAQVAGVTRAFRSYLGKQIALNELNLELLRNSPQKTTVGSLFVPKTSDLIQLH